MKFGTDGVRGVANTDLTASFALELGRAAARVLGGSEAVVGGDTRVSTAMLEAAFVAGLASEGVVVHRLGVVPTPVVAYEASRRDALGAMISASHNPYADNGIKLFARGGTKLTDEVEERIERAVGDLPAPVGDPAQLVDVEDSPQYREHVLAAIGGRRLDGLRIVVDAANGAASGMVGPLLAATGADVVAIHDQPDGRNINDGCGATDPGRSRRPCSTSAPTSVSPSTVTATGSWPSTTTAPSSTAITSSRSAPATCMLSGALREDTVVVTVMANLGFRLAMDAAGIKVVETAVGDRYVLEALDARRLSLGGEQSGHVIFRDVATTGDGLLTGVVLADAVKRSGRSLAELAAASMTRLPQVLLNVPVSEPMADAADRLAAEIAAAEHALGAHGRVLVRPSGTEPLVRVMVEAETESLARTTAERLATAVRGAAR